MADGRFCYVNNVIVGAMHAYLQHDIDRAIIIDFDLHHGMSPHPPRTESRQWDASTRDAAERRLSRRGPRYEGWQAATSHARKER